MAVRRWITAGMLLAMAMTTVGCAISSPLTAQSPGPASPTSSPVAQSSPSPTGASSAQPCVATPGTALLGDLDISMPTVLYGFNADYTLPDELPADKPLTVTLRDNQAYVLGGALQSRPVIQGVFVIGVCNTSSTRTHRLTSFGVLLDSLTPYSGQLNALNGCALLYSRPTGIGGECASGYSPGLELSFHLSGSVAPHATATQTPGTPIALAPGQALDISFGITPPSSPALATYRLGMGVDGAAVSYPSALVTPPRLAATIVRHWAGGFCTAAQMQQQIPATIPANTYYVCPQV